MSGIIKKVIGDIAKKNAGTVGKAARADPINEAVYNRATLHEVTAPDSNRTEMRVLDPSDPDLQRFFGSDSGPSKPDISQYGPIVDWGELEDATKRRTQYAITKLRNQFFTTTGGLYTTDRSRARNINKNKRRANTKEDAKIIDQIARDTITEKDDKRRLRDLIEDLVPSAPNLPGIPRELIDTTTLSKGDRDFILTRWPAEPVEEIDKRETPLVEDCQKAEDYIRDKTGIDLDLRCGEGRGKTTITGRR